VVARRLIHTCTVSVAKALVDACVCIAASRDTFGALLTKTRISCASVAIVRLIARAINATSRIAINVYEALFTQRTCSKESFGCFCQDWGVRVGRDILNLGSFDFV